MSLNRYAAKRDTAERPIMEALTAAGCSVVQLSQKGLGDLLVGFQGRNFILEVKTDNGKLTPAEFAFFEEWEGQITLVRTIEDALEVIGR